MYIRCQQDILIQKMKKKPWRFCFRYESERQRNKKKKILNLAVMKSMEIAILVQQRNICTFINIIEDLNKIYIDK